MSAFKTIKIISAAILLLLLVSTANAAQRLHYIDVYDGLAANASIEFTVGGKTVKITATSGLNAEELCTLIAGEVNNLNSGKLAEAHCIEGPMVMIRHKNLGTYITVGPLPTPLRSASRPKSLCAIDQFQDATAAGNITVKINLQGNIREFTLAVDALQGDATIPSTAEQIKNGLAALINNDADFRTGVVNGTVSIMSENGDKDISIDEITSTNNNPKPEKKALIYSVTPNTGDIVGGVEGLICGSELLSGGQVYIGGSEAFNVVFNSENNSYEFDIPPGRCDADVILDLPGKDRDDFLTLQSGFMYYRCVPAMTPYGCALLVVILIGSALLLIRKLKFSS